MGCNRLQWWKQARFGMFIHWGVYAIPARGEWVMHREHIPHPEYAPLAKQFAPRRFDADAWVRLAKEAGMNYMVLTTRHHDGFSLFDSHVSDFTSVKTAAKRDLVREYVEACHRAGMPVGFYYSLLDWRYDAYFAGPQKDPKGWAELVDYIHAQVRELCSNYGTIDILWYDGGWPWTAEDWRAAELNAMVRQLQPSILINNRSRLPEDFDTPEQHIRASEPGRPWEACMTLNDSWGYNAADDNWKTPKQVIMNLARCAMGGGNFLLNVGPKADGTIPSQSVQILRRVGQWLDRNGGSIYGTSFSPFGGMSTGFSTVKGNTLYLHVLRWPGREITFGRILNTVRSVHMLGSGRPVTFEQRDDRLFLRKLPVNPPDRYDTVIVVELEGAPEALDYVRDGWVPPCVTPDPEIEAPAQETESIEEALVAEAEDELLDVVEAHDMPETEMDEPPDDMPKEA